MICTLTALVILCSGVPIGYGQAAGAELTISGFTATYGGWVSIFTAVGATMNLGLLWSIAETFNGLMVIPNLIAVFLLSGVVVKMVKDYFNGIEMY